MFHVTIKIIVKEKPSFFFLEYCNNFLIYIKYVRWKKKREKPSYS